MAKKSSTIYSNQPGAKHTSTPGKPHMTPHKNVVTGGSGPSGSGNWSTMYADQKGKGGKSC